MTFRSEFAQAVRYWGPVFVLHYGDECRCPPPIRLQYTMVGHCPYPGGLKAYATFRCDDCGLLVKAKEMTA